MPSVYAPSVDTMSDRASTPLPSPRSRVQVDSNQEASVAGTFQAFSKDGYMSQQQFAKLCKDAGLLSKQFTQVSAEITFNKVKKIGNRKMSLKEFQLALEEIAAKKEMELEEVEKMVANTSGPVLVATVPPKNRLHDGRKPYNWRGDADYPPCKHFVIRCARIEYPATQPVQLVL